MIDETTFTFTKSKYVIPMMNIGYSLTNINEDYSDEGNFELVLCSNMPSNPYDAIDENGCLDEYADGLVCFKIEDIYTTESSGLEKPYFNLLVTPVNDYESGFTIELESGQNDIQIKIGDAFNELQGMYLCRRSNNFVMAFARVYDTVHVRNFITVPFDSKLLGIGTGLICDEVNSNENDFESTYF